jgi:hypothetical protein
MKSKAILRKPRLQIQYMIGIIRDQEFPDILLKLRDIILTGEVSLIVYNVKDLSKIVR